MAYGVTAVAAAQQAPLEQALRYLLRQTTYEKDHDRLWSQLLQSQPWQPSGQASQAAEAAPLQQHLLEEQARVLVVHYESREEPRCALPETGRGQPEVRELREQKDESGIDEA